MTKVAHRASESKATGDNRSDCPGADVAAEEGDAAPRLINEPILAPELDAPPRLVPCQLDQVSRKHAFDEEAAPSSVEDPLHRLPHYGCVRGWKQARGQVQRAEEGPLDAPRPGAFDA